MNKKKLSGQWKLTNLGATKISFGTSVSNSKFILLYQTLLICDRSLGHVTGNCSKKNVTTHRFRIWLLGRRGREANQQFPKMIKAWKFLVLEELIIKNVSTWLSFVLVKSKFLQTNSIAKTNVRIVTLLLVGLGYFNGTARATDYNSSNYWFDCFFETKSEMPEFIRNISSLKWKRKEQFPHSLVSKERNDNVLLILGLHGFSG